MKNIFKSLKKWHILKDLGCIFVSHMPKIFIKKSDTFACILITEFNWGNNPLGISEEYLDKRFEIFDKYTFPSVNAQTDKDFTWFIMLNGKTPQKYRDIFEEYKKAANMNLILKYVDNFDSSISKNQNFSNFLNDDFKNHNCKWFLTCRCDNDDMLSKDYIKKMKENFRPVHKMFINFDNGYNFNIKTNALNNYEHNSSHFIGYVERNFKNKKIITVNNCDHSICKAYGVVRRIRDNKPVWCEICHDTNIVNTFRGIPSSEEDIRYFEENFVKK